MIQKILIVDDSPVARKMLRRVIPGDRGYEILEAVNGQDGFEKFQQFRPDITLMDLTMPVLQFHGLKDKAVDKDGLRDTWNWIDSDYTLVTVPASDHWIQREAAGIVNSTMRWWLKDRLNR